MSSDASQLFDPEEPPGSELDDAPPVERVDALSISELYGRIDGALADAFPRNRPLWVRGEIQKISDHSSGHCYIDLIDHHEGGRTRGFQGRAVPILKVRCWKATWLPLRAAMRKEGLVLEEGMVVHLKGSLDVYRPRGEVGFSVSEIDVTALLGGMAARRAALLKKLETEGLLRRNAQLPLPEVALRIGLVASPGTEGYRDFLGQLTGSGFAFDVRVVPVSVQGGAAPGAVATAIRALCRSDCDLVVLVRGGGAKADLAAFETEVVARTIAHATKPIWTGIGHTGDETVADIVAGRSYITPTECGHELALRLEAWWAQKVARPSARLGVRVPSLLEDAQVRDSQARGRLTRAARSQLRVHRERVGRRAGRLTRVAPDCLDARVADLRADAARLGPFSLGHLSREEERVRSWRRLLTAYDVDRQLERGYSLTLTAGGELVRSAADVAEGEEIVTRLADGTLRSGVTVVETNEESQGQ